MTGKIMPLRGRDTSTIQAPANAFLLGGESQGPFLAATCCGLMGACPPTDRGA
jgi:hypothetical protein